MPIHKEQQIIAAAMEHGASLAGIARVAYVRESPSHLAFVRMGDYTGVGTPRDDNHRQTSQDVSPAWPEEAKFLVVVGVLSLE